jgi:hypothetical protein
MIKISLYVPRSDIQIIRDKEKNADFRISNQGVFLHEYYFDIVSTEAELLSLVLKYGSDNVWEKV